MSLSSSSKMVRARCGLPTTSKYLNNIFNRTYVRQNLCVEMLACTISSEEATEFTKPIMNICYWTLKFLVSLVCDTYLYFTICRYKYYNMSLCTIELVNSL